MQKNSKKKLQFYKILKYILIDNKLKSIKNI